MRKRNSWQGRWLKRPLPLLLLPILALEAVQVPLQALANDSIPAKEGIQSLSVAAVGRLGEQQVAGTLRSAEQELEGT